MPNIKPDTNYGQGTGFSVQSIMVRDANGIVRALTQHDTIPACIKNVIASGGGGGGGGAAQSLTVVATTGTSPQYITISDGNTIAVQPTLQTSALVPVSSNVGAVSTTILGGPSGTLGRPDTWLRIAGTNMVVPVYVGL